MGIAKARSTIATLSITVLLAFVSTSCGTTTKLKPTTPAFQTQSPSPLRTPAGTRANSTPSGDALLLSWPLKGNVSLTRGFFTSGHPHQGLDLSVPKGTPVRASHDGYIEYAGREFTGYGKLVIISSGSEWASFYAHLDSIKVHEGRPIHRGDVIGTVGETGNARGVHLHFELRHNQSPVDPMKYLPPVD